jgi:hypothetical protein
MVHAGNSLKEFGSMYSSLPNYPLMFFYDNGEVYMIQHCNKKDFKETIDYLKSNKWFKFTWDYRNTQSFNHIHCIYDGTGCKYN